MTAEFHPGDQVRDRRDMTGQLGHVRDTNDDMILVAWPDGSEVWRWAGNLRKAEGEGA